MTKLSFLKRLDKLKREIATKRDQLDELIAEGQEIYESCEAAERALEEARDALSTLL